MITILGKTEIPEPREAQVPSAVLRDILNSLEPGKAVLVEADSKSMAKQTQRMLYPMAEILFGRRGAIKSQNAENMFYVWLNEGDHES